MRRVLLSTLACTPLLLALPASAAEPATDGWWYQPQRLSGLTPVVLPAPPYVPAGDLLVEATISGPNAVAALRLLVPPGEQAGVLRLPITSTRGVPDVVICKTLSGWGPAEAGNWDLRPSCDGKPLPLAISPDGKTLTTDVSLLVRNGVLDVLLAPRVDEQGTTAAFSITLTAPTVDVLTTTPVPASNAPAAAAPGPPAAPAAPPKSFVPAQPSRIVAGAPAIPGTPGVAAVPAPEVPAPVAALPVAAPQAVRRTAAPADTARTLAVLLLILTAGVAWILSRGRARLPRPLVAVAGTPDPVPDDARGVGRFRAVRAGSPPVRL